MNWYFWIVLFFFSPLYGDFLIEKATLMDNLNEIASVINKAYKRQVFNRNDRERISIAKLEYLIREPGNRLFLLRLDQDPHLICGTLLLSGDEISLFSVHPDYQGQKLGRLLLQAAEKEAFESSASVYLRVIPLFQEHLIEYYKSQGYELEDYREPLSLEKLERIQPCYHEKVYSIKLRKNRSS